MSVTDGGVNNVKAGCFVVTALATGLVVIFVLGDIWNRVLGPATTGYRASFQISDGVGYLKSGSEVRLGGVGIGQVHRVELVTSADPVRTIDIEFDIPSDIALYSNAVATIQSGLISSDSFVQISSVGWDQANRSTGDRGEPGTRLVEGDVLVGTPTGGMLGAMLGPETSAAVQKTVDHIETITAGLRDDGRVLEWIVGKDEGHALERGLGTLGQVFERMDQNGYTIEWILGDQSASDLRDAIAEANTLVARVQEDWSGREGAPGWSAEISTVLKAGEPLSQTITEVRDFITSNRDRFQQIVNGLDQSIVDGQQIIADLRANAPLWSSDVGATLANLELASQQLNLLTAEARNAPWRLLYQPSEKEVTGELIYEASRNFVFGSADVKSAAESLDRLVASRGQSLDTNAADFKLIRDNLAESVRRWEKAREQLAKILAGETVPPAK